MVEWKESVYWKKKEKWKQETLLFNQISLSMLMKPSQKKFIIIISFLLDAITPLACENTSENRNWNKSLITLIDVSKFNSSHTQALKT